MEALKAVGWGVIGQLVAALLLGLVSLLPPPEHKQLVVQGSTDCAWCVKMEREIQKDLAGKYSLATDTAGDAATAQIFLTHKHSARTLPTILITRDGKTVWKHVGYLSTKELVAEFERR
jgi:thioredoxin-related protein